MKSKKKQANCVICSRPVRIKEELEGKEVLCLDCATGVQEWKKYMKDSDNRAISENQLKGMTLLQSSFLFRLVIFAVIGFGVFALSVILIPSPLSFVGWIVGALIGLLVVLPLLFKGQDPLSKKRAEKFYWPFMIAMLAMGMIFQDVVDSEQINMIVPLISFFVSFIVGLGWIAFKDEERKRTSLDTIRYIQKERKTFSESET
jgi:hypothetical protein